ncbi:tRNA glutamyl-Q(34) synthetase GluQRS [Paraglaciecola aquimarina]|uniref:tRNA glutamyl-Q(34) synthetase GluQRS n=1 Tax=Paraglaciecola algarum TaxID=3050085 RepID=A0ABS9D3E2_9ALTE|nr:tRNA glutamyl-Q(34) synthetase GluQRS [Paraglaciecola sp. G1-23]MCF2947448.1 tRNA glutamyl-Q(34) synthetase GluQRS [Paraglaciecola sp. G1-23]
MSSLTLNNASNYVGRFAPSPSGPLHFGSLVTALGSYLQAKSNDGKWLLRIEDIDPPREVAGASDCILSCLEAHQLFWDDSVVYQSQRSELYADKIEWLHKHGFTYHCQCTRAELCQLSQGQICACVGLNLPALSHATRFNFSSPAIHFNDQLLGKITFDQTQLARQFAIRRKDGLFAYQLAVVVDDIQQGITEVARGADLLSATAYQIALYQAFDCAIPQFLHFPVVVSEPGKKLSKQNHASAVQNTAAAANLVAALQFLGLLVPRELTGGAIADILGWAIDNWDLAKLVAKTERIDNRIAQQDSI